MLSIRVGIPGVEARAGQVVAVGFLLQEDGSFLLQEDGSKIVITEVVYA